MLYLLIFQCSGGKLGMVGKPLVSVLQNFNQIENPLNIKKVMSKIVCMSRQSMQTCIH